MLIQGLLDKAMNVQESYGIIQEHFHSDLVRCA